MTPGASGAELANIINEAALGAVRHHRMAVTQYDLQEAVDTILAGAQKKNKILSDKEKCIVAYHEVGHAMVAAMPAWPAVSAQPPPWTIRSWKSSSSSMKKPNRC